LPGKKNSKSPQPSSVIYYYDECLPPKIGEILTYVGFPIEMAHHGIKDEQLIPAMGAKGYTWITKDDRAKTQHEDLIGAANISVIWVRGLAHQRKKKGPISRVVSMKDILRMLVKKLDQASDIIGTAKGKPRYFLLYTSLARGDDKLDHYTSLREVHDRLSGAS